ncbi:MAG: tRNA (adenosine(37)-N6)-dimethylallyltransferase MiaA [Patescibacteria group bacterium]|nr:tRNA (adenosine(37)-N6)-dimethylallyltransferase MiaA [Patescibacteria group bacterium]
MQTPKIKSEAEKNTDLPRVLIVLGPTSSGKTGLSLRIARELNGEIINADARQIYKKLTIGTGKPPGRRGKFMGHGSYLVQVPHLRDYEKLGINQKDRSGQESPYPEIPHYLMDFMDPQKIISVAEWRRIALKAIKGITRRGHLPIIVGGTGLYIKALVENFAIPEVPPNSSLRKSYEKEPLEKLVKLLLKMDPDAETSVDLKNPRRVIRALEICTFTGKPVSKLKVKRPPVIDAFQVGIKWTREQLKERINLSITRMMEEGWPEEVRRLHDGGIGWDAPAMTSIGYREIAGYIRGEILLEEAVEKAKHATHQYAKRQETWFKKDPTIHWAKNEKQALELIRAWYHYN